MRRGTSPIKDLPVGILNAELSTEERSSLAFPAQWCSLADRDGRADDLHANLALLRAKVGGKTCTRQISDSLWQIRSDGR